MSRLSTRSAHRPRSRRSVSFAEIPTSSGRVLACLVASLAATGCSAGRTGYPDDPSFGAEHDEHEGDAAHDDHGEHGQRTGATCPADNALTYDSFGRAFFGRYCLHCHSETRSGASRNGAPDEYNFDTEADIIALAASIDGHAAAGPETINTAMPPSEPIPSEEERRRLGAYMACVAPGSHADHDE